METLNRDELTVIALKLDLPDLLNFCLSNKHIYNKVLNNDILWHFKITYEFPQYREYRKIGELTTKDTYMMIKLLLDMRSLISK